MCSREVHKYKHANQFITAASGPKRPNRDVPLQADRTLWEPPFPSLPMRANRHAPLKIRQLSHTQNLASQGWTQNAWQYIKSLKGFLTAPI